MLAIGCFLILSFSYGSAQYSYQVQSYSGGNPGGINTEADFDATGWTTWLSGGQGTNTWSSPQSLPFNFSFFGQTVFGIKASANGVLTFDVTASSIPAANENIPSSSLPDLSIACFWEEFAHTPPLGTNDVIQYKTFGTAPNRQLWVRWYSYEWGPTSFVYVSTVLEEGTNKIYMVDAFSSPTGSWVTSTVGLQEDNGFGVQYSNSNVPLNPLGSSYLDNHYYEFTPFIIPPQDLKPVEIVSPQGSACGLGQEQVTVRLTNVGQLSATNILCSYSINDGPQVPWETIPGSLASGDSMTYTFNSTANLSVSGRYDLKVWVKGTGDTNALNDTVQTSVEHVQQVSSLPYYEDFESGKGGWETEGNYSSWEWGIPANPTIQGASSGQRAWITDRLGSYNSFENAWVISPCFDLSNAHPDTWVAMKLWWEAESSWDGAALQSSIDGGETWQAVGSFGSPDWYNWQYISSIPGGQIAGWSGWSISGDGSGTWVPVTHRLDPSLIGQASVRFRLAFASGASQNSDGVGFDDFAIGRPPQIDIGADGVYCEGDIVDAGALPGVSYLWSTGATTSSQILVNATGATITDSLLTIIATDNIGLFRRDTIVFTLAEPLDIVSAVANDNICHGGQIGTIDLNLTGGLTPFSYDWSHGSTSEDPDSLFAGAYDVLVTDAYGCSIQSELIVISEPDSIQITTSSDDLSCYQSEDGQITLSATGGTSPYQFQWAHGPTGDSLQGLAAGMYQALILDAAGCEDSLSIEIGEPDSLSLALMGIQDASCIDVADGQIDISILGGTEPYEFSWNNGGSTEDQLELLPGVYTVSVSDTNGCSIQSDSIMITYTDSLPTAQADYWIQGARIAFQDSSSGADSYQWDFGDQSGTSTAPNPRYHYAANGVYNVTQIVSNTCGSDTLIHVISMTTVSNDDLLDASYLSVYPNPAQFHLELAFGEKVLHDVKLGLFSPHGQVIIEESWDKLNPQRTVSISLPPSLSTGLYLLTLTSKEGILHQKVLVDQ